MCIGRHRHWDRREVHQHVRAFDSSDLICMCYFCQPQSKERKRNRTRCTHHHLPVDGNTRGRHAARQCQARGHLPSAAAAAASLLLHFDGAAVDRPGRFQTGAAIPHPRWYLNVCRRVGGAGLSATTCTCTVLGATMHVPMCRYDT